MRIGDFGIKVGGLPAGPLNKISDVPGVTVGHCTVVSQTHNTGVTVVLPGPGNPFAEKRTAAAFVLNGFGKTAGLVQIDELGTLETPIALTNTLNVGRVHDAMVEYMCRICQRDGISLTSVNPVVCECNDASLNDIRHRAVGEAQVFQAIESAKADFEEGAVGCGRGMTCHGLKGGVGSASRVMTLDGEKYTLGVLVQSNHGRLQDLLLEGRPVGPGDSAPIAGKRPGQGQLHRDSRHRSAPQRPPAAPHPQALQRGPGPAGLLYRPRQRRGVRGLFHGERAAPGRNPGCADPPGAERGENRPSLPGRSGGH